MSFFISRLWDVLLTYALRDWTLSMQFHMGADLCIAQVLSIGKWCSRNCAQVSKDRLFDAGNAFLEKTSFKL